MKIKSSEMMTHYNKSLTEESVRSRRNNRYKSPEAGAGPECVKRRQRRLVWLERRGQETEEEEVRELIPRPDDTAPDELLSGRVLVFYPDHDWRFEQESR